VLVLMLESHRVKRFMQYYPIPFSRPGMPIECHVQGGAIFGNPQRLAPKVGPMARARKRHPDVSHLSMICQPEYQPARQGVNDHHALPNLLARKLAPLKKLNGNLRNTTLALRPRIHAIGPRKHSGQRPGRGLDGNA
jgi:hypothetical protein